MKVCCTCKINSCSDKTSVCSKCKTAGLNRRRAERVAAGTWRCTACDNPLPETKKSPLCSNCAMTYNSQPRYRAMKIACNKKRRLNSKIRDIEAQQFKDWYARNAEADKAKTKEWRQANPEAWVAIQQNRRARVKNAEGSFTSEQLIAVYDSQNQYCKACGRSDRPLTADHIVALSNGGTNFISNIQGLCGPCNCSKNDKDFDVWLQSRAS